MDERRHGGCVSAGTGCSDRDSGRLSGARARSPQTLLDETPLLSARAAVLSERLEGGGGGDDDRCGRSRDVYYHDHRQHYWLHAG